MKDKIVEAGAKKFQINERPGEPQVVTIKMLEEYADEILELFKEDDPMYWYRDRYDVDDSIEKSKYTAT